MATIIRQTLAGLSTLTRQPDEGDAQKWKLMFFMVGGRMVRFDGSVASHGGVIPQSNFLCPRRA